MTTVEMMLDEPPRLPEDTRRDASAVSWAAIFAGAIAAAALSLILLVLGTGFGLSSISPWTARGAGVGAITWSTIIWLAFTAVAASGLGGYLAGRLRIRWATTHTDEVYFRDTAHGFLAWAVATVLTAAALTSVIATLLGTGTNAGNAGTPRNEDEPMYVVDALFRLPPVRPETVYAIAPASTRSEMARIFANSIRTGPLPADDARYAAQLVAQSTGLAPHEAESRVSAAYAAAQQKLQVIEASTVAAADRARKNAAHASLWVFVSLLLGAFSASLAATIGGRQRDQF